MSQQEEDKKPPKTIQTLQSQQKEAQSSSIGEQQAASPSLIEDQQPAASQLSIDINEVKRPDQVQEAVKVESERQQLLENVENDELNQLSQVTPVQDSKEPSIYQEEEKKAEHGSNQEVTYPSPQQQQSDPFELILKKTVENSDETKHTSIESKKPLLLNNKSDAILVQHLNQSTREEPRCISLEVNEVSWRNIEDKSITQVGAGQEHRRNLRNLQKSVTATSLHVPASNSPNTSTNKYTIDEEDNLGISSEDECSDKEANAVALLDSCADKRFVKHNDCISKSKYRTIHRGYDNESGCEIAWTTYLLHKYQKEKLLNALDVVRKIGQNNNETKHHKNILRVFYHEVRKVANGNLFSSAVSQSSQIKTRSLQKGQSAESFSNPTLFGAANQNIATQLQNQQPQEELIVVSELITAGSIREYLKKIKTLRLNVIKNWCQKVLEALQFLHESEIVHGEISCETIYINSNDGQIKLGDVGIKHIHTSIRSHELGACNLYMRERNTLKVDVYCFGMTLLEIVAAGETTSSTRSSLKYIIRILNNGQKDRLLAVINNKHLLDFLKIALEEDPNQRYSVRQLLDHPFLSQPISQADKKFIPLSKGMVDLINEQIQYSKDQRALHHKSKNSNSLQSSVVLNDSVAQKNRTGKKKKAMSRASTIYAHNQNSSDQKYSSVSISQEKLSKDLEDSSKVVRASADEIAEKDIEEEKKDVIDLQTIGAQPYSLPGKRDNTASEILPKLLESTKGINSNSSSQSRSKKLWKDKIKVNVSKSPKTRLPPAVNIFDLQQDVNQQNQRSSLPEPMIRKRSFKSHKSKTTTHLLIPSAASNMLPTPQSRKIKQKHQYKYPSYFQQLRPQGEGFPSATQLQQHNRQRKFSSGFSEQYTGGTSTARWGQDNLNSFRNSPNLNHQQSIQRQALMSEERKKRRSDPSKGSNGHDQIIDVDQVDYDDQEQPERNIDTMTAGNQDLQNSLNQPGSPTQTQETSENKIAFRIQIMIKGRKRDIKFEYNLLEDSPEAVANEIQEQFRQSKDWSELPARAIEAISQEIRQGVELHTMNQQETETYASQAQTQRSYQNTVVIKRVNRDDQLQIVTDQQLSRQKRKEQKTKQPKVQANLPQQQLHQGAEIEESKGPRRQLLPNRYIQSPVETEDQYLLKQSRLRKPNMLLQQSEQLVSENSQLHEEQKEIIHREATNTRNYRMDKQSQELFEQQAQKLEQEEMEQKLAHDYLSKRPQMASMYSSRFDTSLPQLESSAILSPEQTAASMQAEMNQMLKDGQLGQEEYNERMQRCRRKVSISHNSNEQQIRYPEEYYRSYEDEACMEDCKNKMQPILEPNHKLEEPVTENSLAVIEFEPQIPHNNTTGERHEKMIQEQQKNGPFGQQDILQYRNSIEYNDPDLINFMHNPDDDQYRQQYQKEGKKHHKDKKEDDNSVKSEQQESLWLLRELFPGYMERYHEDYVNNHMNNATLLQPLSAHHIHHQQNLLQQASAMDSHASQYETMDLSFHMNSLEGSHCFLDSHKEHLPSSTGANEPPFQSDLSLILVNPDLELQMQAQQQMIQAPVDTPEDHQRGAKPVSLIGGVQPAGDSSSQQFHINSDLDEAQANKNIAQQVPNVKQQNQNHRSFLQDVSISIVHELVGNGNIVIGNQNRPPSGHSFLARIPRPTKLNNSQHANPNALTLNTVSKTEKQPSTLTSGGAQTTLERTGEAQKPTNTFDVQLISQTISDSQNSNNLTQRNTNPASKAQHAIVQEERGQIQVISSSLEASQIQTTSNMPVQQPQGNNQQNIQPSSETLIEVEQLSQVVEKLQEQEEQGENSQEGAPEHFYRHSESQIIHAGNNPPIHQPKQLVTQKSLFRNQYTPLQFGPGGQYDEIHLKLTPSVGEIARSATETSALDAMKEGRREHTGSYYTQQSMKGFGFQMGSLCEESEGSTGQTNGQLRLGEADKQQTLPSNVRQTNRTFTSVSQLHQDSSYFEEKKNGTSMAVIECDEEESSQKSQSYSITELPSPPIRSFKQQASLVSMVSSQSNNPTALQDLQRLLEIRKAGMRSEKLVRGLKTMYKEDIINLKFALNVLTGGMGSSFDKSQQSIQPQQVTRESDENDRSSASINHKHFDKFTRKQVKRFKQGQSSLKNDKVVDRETWDCIIESAIQLARHLSNVSRFQLESVQERQHEEDQKFEETPMSHSENSDEETKIPLPDNSPDTNRHLINKAHDSSGGNNYNQEQSFSSLGNVLVATRMSQEQSQQPFAAIVPVQPQIMKRQSLLIKTGRFASMEEIVTNFPSQQQDANMANAGSFSPQNQKDISSPITNSKRNNVSQKSSGIQHQQQQQKGRFATSSSGLGMSNSDFTSSPNYSEKQQQPQSLKQSQYQNFSDIEVPALRQDMEQQALASNTQSQQPPLEPPPISQTSALQQQQSTSQPSLQPKER